jgi:hypothetical protein
VARYRSILYLLLAAIVVFAAGVDTLELVAQQKTPTPLGPVPTSQAINPVNPRTPVAPQPTLKGAPTGIQVATAKGGLTSVSGQTGASECRPLYPAKILPTSTANAQTATQAVLPTLNIPVTEDTGATQAAPLDLTPTPTALPLLFNLHGEMMFPVGVRSDVRVHANPDQIKLAQLHVFIPNTTFSTTLEATALNGEILPDTDTVSFINLAWTIDPSLAPPLFTTLTYEWNVELTNGRKAALSGLITFADIRFIAAPYQTTAWCTIPADPLTLYTSNKGLAVSWAIPQFRTTQNKLQEDLGITSKAINVAVYDSTTTFCQPDPDHPGETNIRSVLVNFSMPCKPEQADLLYRSQGYQLVYADPSAFIFRDQLLEILATQAYSDYWGSAGLPPWLRSGVPGLYGLLARVDALQTVKNAATTGNLLPLSALNDAAPSDPDGRKTWEAESYLFAKYLGLHYGREAFITFVKDIAKTPFDDAFKTLTNSTPERVFADWQSWIATDDAASAVNISFYDAATLTPTLTETPFPTPIPPSPLPTDTPFPTLTPIPPTATLTPIPAGIFATWTPVAPKTNANTNRGLCPGSTIWVVLPGLIVIFNRRKKR